jgi:hypothetical protein
MWTKQEQIVTESYLVKYLASSSIEQEIVNHSRQLFTLNSIIVEKICQKKNNGK